MEETQRLILGLLCREKRALTSAEIFERIAGETSAQGMEELRKTLADLVREGLVERVPAYERSRMAFRATERACRG